jgi:hypothetical protein
VAHSLGSIYAFDVLNSLIGDGEHFDPGSRKTWPIQGLLTLGSPIGLDMFKVTGRNSIRDFGLGDKCAARILQYVDINYADVRNKLNIEPNK